MEKDNHFRNKLNSLQLKILLGFVLWYINNLLGFNILFIPLAVYFAVILYFISKILIQLKDYPYKKEKQLGWSLIIVSCVFIVFSITVFITNNFSIS